MREEGFYKYTSLVVIAFLTVIAMIYFSKVSDVGKCVEKGELYSTCYKAIFNAI